MLKILVSAPECLGTPTWSITQMVDLAETMELHLGDALIT